MRVANEVRIFPVIQLDGQRSAFLNPTIAQVEACGRTAELVAVEYEFQRGTNQMLRIR